MTAINHVTNISPSEQNPILRAAGKTLDQKLRKEFDERVEARFTFFLPYLPEFHLGHTGRRIYLLDEVTGKSGHWGLAKLPSPATPPQESYLNRRITCVSPKAKTSPICLEARQDRVFFFFFFQ